MSPRAGKFKHGKNSKKFKNKPKGKNRKPQKPKYNLATLSQGKRPAHDRQQKKGYVPREPKPVAEVPVHAEDEMQSEEEEEDEDNMKQLLSTFANVKKNVRCDSEEDSSEDEEMPEEIDEEAEDEEESGVESDENESSDENEAHIDDSTEDPFEKHLLHDLNVSLLASVQTIPITTDLTQETWPELGRLQIEIPKCVNENRKASSVGIEEDKVFAERGCVPQRIHTHKANLNDIFIKTQIHGNIEKFNKSLRGGHKLGVPFTPLQSELFAVMNNYQDLYFPERTFDNAEEIRFVYCLHALNHILKTRMRVIHHNARLSKKDDVPEDFRDQGLTRPKILIIAPFRNAAYKIINNLIHILLPEDKGNVMNKNRFLDEFTGEEIQMPKKNPKPEDYEQLFSGNTSDDFKIGITVTKKSLKLYADFYSSDIIVTSPLGLRSVIGAEGESDRDFDFLASIELLIMDQSEVFLMQNWDHLLHIFNHMHLQPKDSHGTDFSRVRTWSLNGWAKFYRQTLVFSGVMLPEINSVFNKKCFNYAGRVRVMNPVQGGTIGLVYTQLPHVYHRFDCKSVAELTDARFNFFLNKVLPQQRDQLMRQTLIYVPNYFDYVHLRNYFKKEDISFVQICEYSKEGKIARARDMFFHGDAHFMLYTERYHFFNRKRIKGIKHIVFYQPPNFPHFYYEMCNLMQQEVGGKKKGISNMTVTVMYSKYDVQQLSAIVGSERAMKMISSDKNVHMLVTD